MTALKALPRSQGIIPGLIGYVFLEAVVLYVLFWTVFRTSALVFTVLMTAGGSLNTAGLATRVSTIVSVRRGHLAIRKTVSRTEAFIPYAGSPAGVLETCRLWLESSPSYENVNARDAGVNAILKGDLLSRRSSAEISVAGEGVLRISYELAQGGSIWADSGKHERAAQFLRKSLPRS